MSMDGRYAEIAGSNFSAMSMDGLNRALELPKVWQFTDFTPPALMGAGRYAEMAGL
ncbi:MAG: hypothetical protein KJ930_03790 [Gammaproteobacteria bacterium]|nr:hypothetical protein [Gammaproteobacteria bacterium]MBU2178534.1 hypothetical protein [Gammaproteobacteria bacterium]MBU2224612.1 hypothetical protein [Gammaproteobacteria bacterium]MBU2280050.1 hypothetical protein [Gammaproteobacteria bacterium]MBU2428255.1 hypothetical protein [Gammaproteobacteria bacterium]